MQTLSSTIAHVLLSARRVQRVYLACIDLAPQVLYQKFLLAFIIHTFVIIASTVKDDDLELLARPLMLLEPAKCFSSSHKIETNVLSRQPISVQSSIFTFNEEPNALRITNGRHSLSRNCSHEDFSRL